MTRPSVGREASIVSSQPADDWPVLEAPTANESPGRGRTRSSLAPRQLTVLVAALLAIAVSAAILILLFARGDDGAAAETQPSVVTPRASTTPSAPVASLRVTLPEQGRIGRGSSGAVVTRLQRALVALGLDPGPRDGAFGSKTQAAVIVFQRQQGLAADGVVGRRTAAALNAALADRSR